MRFQGKVYKGGNFWLAHRIRETYSLDSDYSVRQDSLGLMSDKAVIPTQEGYHVHSSFFLDLDYEFTIGTDSGPNEEKVWENIR